MTTSNPYVVQPQNVLSPALEKPLLVCLVLTYYDHNWKDLLMTKITFIFLLTIYSAETPRPQVYVMNSGLSGTDCIAAIKNYNTTSPMWSHGNPSCEIDTAVDY